MTDEELIARLRKADEYEPLGHDGWEAADRIEALVKDRADLSPALAVPEVKALVEAATILHRSMELFFEADEAADEAEREGRQKEAARLRNMATGRWQSIPGSLDALAAALKGAEHV